MDNEARPASQLADLNEMSGADWLAQLPAADWYVDEGTLITRGELEAFLDDVEILKSATVGQFATALWQAHEEDFLDLAGYETLDELLAECDPDVGFDRWTWYSEPTANTFPTSPLIVCAGEGPVDLDDLMEPFGYDDFVFIRSRVGEIVQRLRAGNVDFVEVPGLENVLTWWIHGGGAGEMLGFR